MDDPKQNEYEEEQIQKILIEESEKKRIQMDRELKISQEKEYEKALEIDLKNTNTSISPSFDEPSTEEMRRIRLIRFDGYQLIKDLTS